MLSNSFPKQLHQCRLCLYHELLIMATWEALWWTWFVRKVKYVTKKENKRLSRTSRSHQGDLAWIKAKLCKPCPSKGCSGQAWSPAWATFCKQRNGTIWLASLAITRALLLYKEWYTLIDSSSAWAASQRQIGEFARQGKGSYHRHWGIQKPECSCILPPAPSCPVVCVGVVPLGPSHEELDVKMLYEHLQMWVINVLYPVQLLLWRASHLGD